MIVANVFRAFECNIIVYLRNQTDYLVSAWTQRVHATEYYGSVSHYFEHNFRARYDEFLELWESAFPGRIVVRLFDNTEMLSGDVVTDFAVNGLGIPAEELETCYSSEKKNPSLTREVLEFKRCLNRQGLLPFKELDKLYYGLGQYSLEFGHRPCISKALYKKVKSMHDEGNRKVAEAVFNREKLFISEESPSDEIFEWNESVFERIRSDLMMKIPEHRTLFTKVKWQSLRSLDSGL